MPLPARSTRKLAGLLETLTPQSTRRTLYGKVSRYKLDDFLQLFDFPSPNISAEQRYATNVPLQRLFFMNSDFVQQQAELLARRIEAEPTPDGAHTKGLSSRVRPRGDARRNTAWSRLLRNEPLKEYEERKKAEEEKEKKKAEKKEMADKQVEAPAVAQGGVADMPDTVGMDPNGMMAGVVPGPSKSDEKKPLLPVTPWGRYVKILLSSTEFIFIN